MGWIGTCRLVRGEVLSPPQGNGSVVVAQTYDGKLQGLDFNSGEIIWTYDSNVPVLTVRGTSVPILRTNVVYAGFANGRVLAFDALTGAIASVVSGSRGNGGRKSGPQILRKAATADGS